MHRQPVIEQSEVQALVGLIQAGRGSDAEQQAARLLQRAPGEPALHFLIGMALQSQSRLETAAASFREALRLSPDLRDASKNLGGALHRLGRLDEAVTVYNDALRRHPADAGIMESLGLALEAQERTDEAAAAYGQALSLDPNLFLAQVNLGILRGRQNRLTEAVQNLRKALSIREHGAVHMHLGNALRLLGQNAEAVHHLERAVALKPAQALHHAYLAIARQASGLPATPSLERILDLPIADSDDVSMHMWAALQLGRPELAFSYKPSELNVLDSAALDGLRRFNLETAVAALPPLGGTQPIPSTRPLVTASASGDYAAKYAAPLIDSVLAHCPGADFHLHVMNPGAYDVAGALQHCPNRRVTWSTEEAPGAGRVLYSTRRFVRLARMLRESARLTVSLDIDAVARGDFIAALNKDFGALVFERPDMPWAHQMINAGFLALTPHGQGFIDFVAAYILHFENAGTARWYVDQLGMVAARQWLARHDAGLTIGAAPRKVMDWNPETDAMIWHFKGAKKPDGAAD